jgi:hypothetical protein
MTVFLNDLVPLALALLCVLAGYAVGREYR